MSGRRYSVTFTTKAFTTTVDVFELAPADDKPVKLLAVILGNVGGTADSADADSEQLPVEIIRGNTTTGLGGFTTTANPLNISDVAAGAVAKTMNTTPATAGAWTSMFACEFNVRAGSREYLPEECWIEASQTNSRVRVQLGAPADSINLQGTLIFQEDG